MVEKGNSSHFNSLQSTTSYSIMSNERQMFKNQLTEDKRIYLLENLQRQVHELQAIEAMYADSCSNLQIRSTMQTDSDLMKTKILRGSENVSLEHLLQSTTDVIIIHPQPLHHQIKELIDLFHQKGVSSDVQVKINKLYVNYLKHPLSIMIFLKQCTYMRTHIGFHIVLHPDYPENNSMVTTSVVIVCFDQHSTVVSFNSSSELHSSKTFAILHYVKDLESIPDNCSIPLGAIRRIEEQLEEEKTESDELMGSIIQKGQDLVTELINCLTEEEHTFQMYLKNLQMDSRKIEVNVEPKVEDNNPGNLFLDVPSFPTSVKELDRTLGRRLFYSHHIISDIKRNLILTWAVELNLRGYSKIGWPGVIIVEGPEASCREYGARLQRLRWKYFVCRGEQTITCMCYHDSLEAMERASVLPEEMKELGPDRMNELSALCTSAGLRDLFLTSMKIYPSSKEKQNPPIDAVGSEVLETSCKTKVRKCRQ